MVKVATGSGLQLPAVVVFDGAVGKAHSFGDEAGLLNKLKEYGGE